MQWSLVDVPYRRGLQCVPNTVTMMVSALLNRNAAQPPVVMRAVNRADLTTGKCSEIFYLNQFSALFIGDVFPLCNHQIKHSFSKPSFSVAFFWPWKKQRKLLHWRVGIFWYASVHLDVLFSHNSSLASVLRNVQVPLPETQTRAKHFVMKETSVTILSRSLAAKVSKQLSLSAKHDSDGKALN